VILANTLQAVMQTLAPGIAQAVPPTSFSCEMRSGDGTVFTLAGTTPAFPRGWDPNRTKPIVVESTHSEAFKGQAGADPGDASEWFRDFQVSDVTREGVRYSLQLQLRREGTSIAHMTRYQSTGRPVPYEYHAVGLCTAGFSPAEAEKRLK
jgi:hypothetical protein